MPFPTIDRHNTIAILGVGARSAISIVDYLDCQIIVRCIVVFTHNYHVKRLRRCGRKISLCLECVDKFLLSSKRGYRLVLPVLVIKRVGDAHIRKRVVR